MKQRVSRIVSRIVQRLERYLASHETHRSTLLFLLGALSCIPQVDQRLVKQMQSLGSLYKHVSTQETTPERQWLGLSWLGGLSPPPRKQEYISKDDALETWLNFTQEEQKEIYQATYSSATDVYLHYTLSAWCRQAEKEVNLLVEDAFVQVFEPRRQELRAPLVWRGKRLSQKKEQMEKLYFVTHLLFMANAYGTRRVWAPAFTASRQRDLFEILCSWFQQMYAQGTSVLSFHLEILCEIGYSLCYLYPVIDTDTRTRFPLEALYQCLEYYVKLGEHRSFEQTPLGRSHPHAVFLPSAAALKQHVDPFYVDYHTHIVLAFFLLEVIQLQCHSTILTTTTKESVLSGLEQTGWYAGSWTAFATTVFQPLQNYIRALPATEGDIVIQLSPQKNVGGLITPEQASSQTLQAVRKLCRAFPRTFWSSLQHELAQLLGLPVKRILLFPHMTYLRMKSGKAGHTRVHADFFYFLQETDLFRHVASQPHQSGCVFCGTHTPYRFTYVSICLSCAQHQPLPLYTAWFSLGDYTKNTHSLLEFLPTEIPTDYAATVRRYRSRPGVTQDKPLFSTPILHQWFYPLSELHIGDFLLFQAKVIHRARARSGTRCSLDVRFALLPEV